MANFNLLKELVHCVILWLSLLFPLLLSFFFLLDPPAVWDTYLCEENGDGFKAFHVYVCAAFLVRWSSKLKVTFISQQSL